MHKYTEEEVIFLKSNAAGKSYTEITRLLNERFGLELNIGQIKGTLARHRICNGLDGQFKQSHIPFNKGMKGIAFGGKETQFKKGNCPHNHKPVGSERISVDGYLEVKIADPKTWKQKHRIVWEEANGPVPKGHAVIFADGNKSNLEMDNLLLVSRRELAVMNKLRLISGDAESTKTGVVIADVYLKIGERKKGK